MEGVFAPKPPWLLLGGKMLTCIDALTLDEIGCLRANAGAAPTSFRIYREVQLVLRWFEPETGSGIPARLDCY